ncbi:MAG: hypothetical protein GF355_02355 [Candidatus Eisenbacteria bacterium]|nr:hypothetical protein [Candidatus Eisenbacteria bacterium]
MTSWPGRERRRYRRVPVRMALETEVGKERRPAQMETFNMSAGGFSCRLERCIEPLTLLRLGVSFPSFGEYKDGPHEVDCTAVVVRCDPWPHDEKGGFELAAAFTWIRPEDRELLAAYLNWYERIYLMPDEEASGRAQAL